MRNKCLLYYQDKYKMDMRSTLSYIWFIRLLRRIYWKIRPVSEEQINARLAMYLAGKRYPEIASVNDTIKKILHERCSIARYGDGEYNLCMGRSIFFQQYEPSLRRRLLEILQDPDNGKCLIGIAEYRTDRLTSFWRKFWYENFTDICRMVKDKGHYYNQGISREVTIDEIESLSAAWQDRNVIFVTGKGSRFHEDHIIFSNIKSKKSIHSLPQNAWTDYDNVRDKTRDMARDMDDPLIICSLGPTATVLAYDLAMIGLQSLDLGHISNQYDGLKHGAPKPEDMAIKRVS